MQGLSAVRARHLWDTEEDTPSRTRRCHPLGGRERRADVPIRAPTFAVWITRGQGAACDACGKTITSDESQYQLVAKEREMRLDRDCFRRRMDGLTAMQ
jgi:hypothetical protein